MIHHTHHQTPIGGIRLRATDKGLLAIDHVNQQSSLDPASEESPNHLILQQAIAELDEYFAGNRQTFHTPLAPTGTPFQLSVWEALKTIPYGETASYSYIATHISNPKAVRAVGAANGRNPLSIFIPCHRIIGKNGTLTGYAGGLDKKKILLNLEQKTISSNDSFSLNL